MPPTSSTSASTALDDVIILQSQAPDAAPVAYDVRTGAHVKSYTRASRGAAGGVAALGDTKLLTLSVDKRALDAHDLTKESLENSSVLSERPSAIATSGDGAYACAGSASGACAAWDAKTGRLLARWKAHFKAVSCVKFSACGGVIVTGGEDGAVHAWRLSTLFDEEGGASGGGGGASAWRSWTEHALGVRGLALGGLRGVGGDVTIVSCSGDRACKIYSLASGAVLRECRLPTALTCVALDACEATLYAGGVDGRVFEIPLNAAPSIGASLDGGADARDGIVALEGHAKALVSVECTRDGAAIITASEDGTARIWDAASRQTLHILRHPKASICATVLVPRSRYSGQGRGDAGAEKTRSKPTPPPTFSKFLIGAGDRSGVKPWQGPNVVIRSSSSAKRQRREMRVDEDAGDGDVATAAVPDAAETADIRVRLNHALADAAKANADVEQWKTLYLELKQLVDRQLVDSDA
jgi:pre-rRNA-processing protein IPI3